MAVSSEKLSIETSKDLAQWLENRPRDWAAILAVRASLRVLPIVLAEQRIRGANSARLILSVVRANLVAWTACRNGQHAQDLRSAAASAASAVASDASDASFAADAAASAASAVAYAVSANDVPDFEYNAADSAASAAADDAVDVWKAISADADWLVQHESKNAVGELFSQPLWLIDVRRNPDFVVNFPVWAREPFDAFDKSDWATIGPWRVWLVWYRQILGSVRGGRSADLFTNKVALEIASQGEAFWARDPHRVTATVATLVGWKWDELNWIWPNSKPELSAPQRKPSPKKKAKTKQRPPKPSPLPPPVEAVGVHSDEPTDVDQLNRWPFAKALVEHMDDVYWQQESKFAAWQRNTELQSESAPDFDGFAMHIHAPWGAGKTSVIKMMRKMLEQTDRLSKGGRTAPQWVVVEFNAWKNERRNPPWWPLIEQIKSACVAQLRKSQVFNAMWLSHYWLWWKCWTVWLPYLVSGVVLAASFFIVWNTWGTSGTQSYLENILKIITAFGAVLVSFVGVSRFAVFGSTTSAKFYDDLSQDPIKWLDWIFKKIVETTKMPICIVIDDLDRCRPDYVVALLQGVQTIFRHRSVTYVVAADRNWIKTSFEKQYEALKDTIGSPSQPLGYLFLEKVFQVSAPLPAISEGDRAAYWDTLLNIRSAGTAQVGGDSPEPLSEKAVEAERAKIRADTPNLTRKEADARLKTNDTAVVRAALALEISTSKAAEVEATHLLAEFKDDLPEIPRVMKRMINAFAIRQAIGLLVNNGVPVKSLARWTILEQSYPALADKLTEKPDWVTGGSIDPKKNPFIEILKSSRFAGIIGRGADRLTPAQVETITRGAAEAPVRASKK